MSSSDPLASPEALRAALLRGGETPPFAEAILASQEPWITATLVEILASPELQAEDGPGEGWAPIHAARLLCARRDVQAIEPLLRVLVATDPLDGISDEIELGLPNLGPAVLEPALAVYAAHTDGAVRNRLISVLSRLEVADERVFALLVAELPRCPELAAGCLVERDDPRALEPLGRALDAQEIPADAGPLAGSAIIELATAIEDLGGTLTPAQRAKLAAAQAPSRAFRDQIDAALATTRAAAPVRRPARPGRNEPCWCGSARKYKKCHLDEDEQQARA